MSTPRPNALSWRKARMSSKTKMALKRLFIFWIHENGRENNNMSKKRMGGCAQSARIWLTTNMIDYIGLKTNVKGQGHGCDDGETVNVEEVAFNLWHLRNIWTTYGYVSTWVIFLKRTSGIVVFIWDYLIVTAEVKEAERGYSVINKPFGICSDLFLVSDGLFLIFSLFCWRYANGKNWNVNQR